MPTKRNFAAIAERLKDEELLPLSQAARLCPASGRRKHCSAQALHNWVLRGKRGVYLDAVRCSGKTWFTSREALRRFWAAISDLDAGRITAADRLADEVTSGDADRARRHAAAMADIERIIGKRKVA